MGGFNPAWFIAVGLGMVVAIATAASLSPSWKWGLRAVAVFFLLVGLVGLGVDFHAAYELRLPFVPRQAAGIWENKPLRQVWNKTFSGETVPLDNYEYVNSTFDNVTFAYEGTAPTRITNSFIRNPEPGQRAARVVSHNPAVNQTMMLMILLDQLSGGSMSLTCEAGPQ
jgi:hypothetical protein